MANLEVNFEKELAIELQDNLDSCVRDLKAAYERKGYEVSSTRRAETDVSIVPDKIRIDFSAPMTITKEGEGSNTFRSFEVEIKSEMYDILIISTSIVDFETNYGDAQTSLYYSRPRPVRH